MAIMESKTQNQLPESEWSFGEIFGLVAVAVLVCAAMAAYWSFEEDLPRLSWGVALLFGIMAGLMGIAFALRAHYGKDSLLGSRFIHLSGSLVFLFVSTMRYIHGSSGSIAFVIISYALGLFIGIAIGALSCGIEKKHLIGGRLTWTTSYNITMLATIVAAVGLFFMLNELYPDLNGIRAFAGLYFGMNFYSLVWTCLYEKRNNVRVTIEH